MTKKLPIAVFLFFNILFSVAVCGQNFYLGLSGGYNFFNSSSVTYNYTSTTQVNFNNTQYSNTTYELVKGSLGKGTSIGIILGYNLTKYVSAEVNLSYLLSSKVNSVYYSGYNSSSISYFDRSNLELTSRMLRIMPSLKIQAPLTKITPYVKAGIVIGVGTKIKTEQQSVSSSGYGNVVNYSIKTEYNGGLPFGFSGAFGGNYKLNKKFSIFGEFNFISQNWAPRHRKMTSYVYNGTDVLNNLLPYQRETDYVDNYTEKNVNGNPEDPYTASKELKSYHPFSSWGISVGLQMNLGKLK